ncbi:unnamed protein product, partial [Protopolystoma xenopodis]
MINGLIGQKEGRHGGQGSLYTGHLQLLGQLDAERNPRQMIFELVAVDQGVKRLTARALVELTLVNVNDHAPRIAFLVQGRQLLDQRLALPEEVTPIGALVAQVQVADLDSPLEQLNCRLLREADSFGLEETPAPGQSPMSAPTGRPSRFTGGGYGQTSSG